MRKSAISEKELFYDRFALEFDSKVNMYDTLKRLKVVFCELLSESEVRGKIILDAGAGTGWFSQKAVELSGKVISMDVGTRLLQQVAKKCESTRVAGSILDIPFKTNSFDVVISSEVVEHTPDPLAGISELIRVLKPGGILALTTPNRIWHFAITIANCLHARPYQGLENWISFGQLRSQLLRNNATIERMQGFHLVPFVHPLLYPLIDFFDRFARSWLGRLMLNMAVRARKSF